MSLSIGIVGLPNVGKSTLFNALTKNNVLVANYPFATIDPNTGVVPLPDDHLPVLAEIFKSKRILPATVTFVDIAGLVAGAHKGEGMGNAFLSHIRETDAIVQVVRAFEDANVQHVSRELDPQKDIAVINTELILADIQTIDGHLPKLTAQAKGDKSLLKTIELLESLRAKLDQDVLAIDAGLDLKPIKYLSLLSAKPIIYVFNVGEHDLGDEKKLSALLDIKGTDKSLIISAKLEAELSELSDEDATELMKAYGLEESGLQRLSSMGFKTLGLQTFLTAGEKETRAWTIKQGATAPEAAGVIHGDFQRGFIAAEIVSYDDLVAAGSWLKARSLGRLRTEGKAYVMQPNDVVIFRFNV